MDANDFLRDGGHAHAFCRHREAGLPDGAVPDRYVFLTTRYGDVAMPSSSEDAEVVHRMVPRYDDGTLHDLGCVVRERGGEGRHGVLFSSALEEDHDVAGDALARASRQAGAPVMFFRNQDPPHTPEVAVFVPLDDPRLAVPGSLVEMLDDLAATATPRTDLPKMPEGISRVEAHVTLKRVLEDATVGIVFRGLALGTAGDGGPLSKAWALYADMRGGDIGSALRAVAGDRQEWIDLFAGNGHLAFAPSPVTAERILAVMEGVASHAEARGWRSCRLGEAWSLVARMRGVTLVEAAESIVGSHDAQDVLEANGCQVGGGAPRP